MRTNTEINERVDSIDRLRRVVGFYLLAKAVVIDQGFAEEIAWQNELRLWNLHEGPFLREAAWVVLSAGMRETVIRERFPKLSRAFHHWRGARAIILTARASRRNALRVFNHPKKIDSIIEIACAIETLGFDALKLRICLEGISYLRSLPFIGPVTSYHLAKNIGLDVVKPDRHLQRISNLAGYTSPTIFCQEISACVGDRLSVVDLVLWRYATLNPGYRHFLNRYLS